MFPEIGVPQSSSSSIGWIFHFANHLFWVPPWQWKPPVMFCCAWRIVLQILGAFLARSQSPCSFETTARCPRRWSFRPGNIWWSPPCHGVPQARWMAYFMENPIHKWMMNRGTPMTMETSIHR